MEGTGQPAPEYRQDEDFMVTLWRKDGSGTVQSDPESLPNSKESARSWQGVGKELARMVLGVSVVIGHRT